MITKEDLEKMKAEGIPYTQHVRFKSIKSSSEDMQKTNIDVRMIATKIYDEEIVFRRRDLSKNKLFAHTVDGIITNLNHFLAYLQLHEKDVWLDWMESFVYVLFKAEQMLDTNKIHKHCQDEIAKAAELGLDTPYYRKLELDYFRQFLWDNIVDNKQLLAMFSNYIKDITIYNFDSSEIEDKLDDTDIHITCVLGMYAKLIYFFYYRVSGNGQFIDVVKDIIVKIANNVNRYTMEYVFPEKVDYLKISYMDRLHRFFEFSNKTEFKKHALNMDKFSCLGVSEAIVTDGVITEIVSALYRIKIVTYDKNTADIKDMFEDIFTFYDWGFVSKGVAKYIQSTKGKVIGNNIGNKKTAFILKEHSSSADGDDNGAETNRFEVYLQKKDKEWADEYAAIKDHIVLDVYNKVAIPDLIDRLVISGFDKNIFNKMMVSIFLEKEYKCDISDILNLREFTTMVLYIHQRLNKYPVMKNAILGRIQKGINKNNIEVDEIPDVYTLSNPNRTMNLLNEVVGHEYVVINEGVISPAFNVRDNLVSFLQNGCLFE